MHGPSPVPAPGGPAHGPVPSPHSRGSCARTRPSLLLLSGAYRDLGNRAPLSRAMKPQTS